MTLEKIKAAWWFQPFRYLFRFFVFFLVLFYVFFGAMSAWNLYKMHVVRGQDIGVLQEVIRAAAGNGRPADVTAWVNLRPLAETEVLVAALTPESGSLDFSLFFTLARRELMLEHEEEALFWMQLGRYRMRYDVLRCGVPGSSVVIDKILAAVAPPKISELLTARPELVKKSVRRVLDFDAKYPAANSPALTCSLAGKIAGSNAPAVPQEHWEMLRSSLRAATEAFLKSPGQN